ncbi:MAG: ABC transporter permease [Hyphomicrobiaceae bacterium]
MSEAATSVSDPALFASTLVDGRLEIEASGRWTSDRAAALDAGVGRILETIGPGRTVRLRMGSVAAFDTYGACILARLEREMQARGAQFEVSGLSERFAGLARKVGALGDRAVRRPPKRHWSDILLTLRGGASRTAADGLVLLNLLGAVAQALVVAVRRPASFRLTSLVHQLDRACWQAVPIILLITLLIGGIIAQQGFFHFRKFGADQYVVDMVGILVLREIGVLLVAIMVAGRSGSSYTAELGTMKMREEIDALQTMGLDPVAVLILPRILALVIALPILTFLGMMAALYGGGFVAWTYGGMSPNIFISRLHEAISITHFEVGLIKAPFMALIIGIVACAEGLKVRGSAESLGLRTTASVVKAIFLVIVLDGLFAMYFAAIGM